MATKALTVVNGLPRMEPIDASLPTIYDEVLEVVSGTPANSNEVQGPVSAGTPVTLPNSGDYTGLELEIDLNGQDLVAVRDFNYVGSGTKTQVSFTFELVVTDELRFRKTRDE